jgi:hypothetical protein
LRKPFLKGGFCAGCTFGFQAGSFGGVSAKYILKKIWDSCGDQLCPTGMKEEFDRLQISLTAGH